MLAHGAHHAHIERRGIQAHGHGGGDIARADRVAADILIGEQHGGMLCDADDSRLGSDINGSASAVIARYGRHVDDGRARFHIFERGADALHGAHFVDGDDFFRVLVEILIDGFQTRVQNARVVDENIDGAEFVLRRFHERLAVRILGDVGGNGQHAAACGFDFFRHGVERACAPCADDDVCALFCEQKRRRFAYARVAACDNCRFAL